MRVGGEVNYVAIIPQRSGYYGKFHETQRQVASQSFLAGC